MPDDRALSARCRALAQTVEEAKGWVEANADAVGNERASLLAGLRRSGRLLRRCAKSAERKMCVGVFGPSQTGKSYLISSLARDENGALLANFGDSAYDFLKKINPEGNKESTGQVTRFTMTPPPVPDSQFPVYVRLLSESDIVKILANTYYEDWKHGGAADRQGLIDSLDRLAKKRGRAAAGLGKMDLDDLEDLEEYVVAKARLSPAGALLDGAYWTRVKEFAPELAVEGRTELFSHIWGGTPELTSLYAQLARALEQMDFASEAHCGLDALIPRETSIIDVDRLSGLLDRAGAQITLRTGAGKVLTLPRPVMTAVTAELIIHMKNRPDELFEHTDLLDFPGYRARLGMENIEDRIREPAILKESYLRGKVAYLFERYCAQKELTSMLLCVGPGNQEAHSLPRAVNAWIAETHGDTPEARRGREPALFFVLTKFDTEFEDKRGASPTPEGRWQTRIHTGLNDFFGKEFKWPDNWDGKPFRNVYWMRNPDIKSPGLFAYDDDTEIEVRPDQLERMNWLRDGFLRLKEARAHFKDPAAAWEAAMAFNDGGVTYLRDNLRPLCNPELKHNQVSGMADREAANLLARLAPFHKDDDTGKEQKKQRLMADNMVESLAGTVSAQRFAELLRGLQLEDYRYYNLYYQMQSDRALGTAKGSATAANGRDALGTRTSKEDLLRGVYGPAASASNAAAEPESLDEAAEFSRLIEKTWVGHMRELAEDSRWQQYFSLSASELASLVHELAAGAARQRVIQEVEEKIRTAISYRNINPERMIWRQVSLAAATINSFVNWLGFSPYAKSLKERTLFMDGNSLPLFEQKDLDAPVPALSENRPAFDRDYYISWMNAFIRLVIDNVTGSTSNPEQNARLGKLLRVFERAGRNA